MITVDHLSKTYHLGDIAVRALRSVSLTIAEGEFVAIMGPSGSGKSTFMNILGCLDRASEGSYRLEGQEVAGMDDDALAEVRSRKIGFVFQSYNLVPRRSALRQVMLPLLYNPEARGAAIEHRARMVLERVGLSDRLHHTPREMSGGQQQRVAIARALINDPRIIFGDEPTGNLDTRTSEEIMAILQTLHAEGRTIVIVTHEEEIARHTRRIIRFTDGQVVLDTPVTAPVDARTLLAAMPVEDVA